VASVASRSGSYVAWVKGRIPVTSLAIFPRHFASAAARGKVNRANMRPHGILQNRTANPLDIGWFLDCCRRTSGFLGPLRSSGTLQARPRDW
jgi:hypothetical protein